jgi:ubiquinone/menaquinone biosynthesis C-methylase UbiE
LEPDALPLAEPSPAALAFDSIAEGYDARFRPWLSVMAQRRAIRAEMEKAFPPGSRLIEIGGGTGDDALWLAGRGCEVLLTDAAPAMVRVAAAKFVGRPELKAELASADDLAGLADQGAGLFDGAYSVFAPLNCVTDLEPFARGLARLLRPGAPALLVVFGRCCPGEVVVEALRGRPKNMFRRLGHGDVPARLSGQSFSVRYHSRKALTQALSPWFAPKGRIGVGVFTPPSAAEPSISRHPGLLRVLEQLDRLAAGPLAALGDHILYRFERTATERA